MTTRPGISLPRDSGGVAIQGVFSPLEDGGRKIVVGASSGNVQLDPATNVILVYATEDCWIQLGADNTVAAIAGDQKSTFIPGSRMTDYMAISLGGPGGTNYSWLAVIEDSTPGILYIIQAR